MGGFKIREFIKNKIGHQPVNQCSICFNFVNDDDEITEEVFHTLENLHTSANAGCFTCSILRDAVAGVYGTERFPMTQPIRFELGYNSPRLILSDLDNSHWGSRPTIEFTNNDDDSKCPWKVMDDSYMGPPIATTTKSADTYEWMSHYLKDCLENHPNCGNPSETPLPTRAIDVNYQENKVRVVETKGQHGNYVALSHCWGDQNLMNTKLTAQTFEEYTTDGIPVDTFPRTFQDAIEVTRKLGIPYLWIDSMCIIQGDAEDWAKESATMCAVYTNCYVTLAGISATNCKGGLFCGSLGATELNGETPKGKPYSLFAREMITHSLRDYPLLSRGWCFQETLLAPRTLYFGAKEMLWLCRESRNCQCCQIDNKREAVNHELGDDSPFFKLPSRSIGLEGANQPFNPVERWHELINAYSKTRLSFETDRFTAIQGLSDYMRHWRQGEEYFAGAWSGSVVKDLMWKRNTLQGPLMRKKIDADTRKTDWSSDKWLFPTWSWASLSSKSGTAVVEYPLFWGAAVSNMDSRPYPDDAFLAYAADEALVEDSDVEAQDQTVGKKPRYELRLKGRVFPVSHETLLRALGEPDLRCDYGDFEEDDWKENVDPEAAFYCMRMMKHNGHFIALVLICVDEENQIFERFGLLDWDRKMFGSTISGTLTTVLVEKRWRPEWWEPSDGEVLQEKIITII